MLKLSIDRGYGFDAFNVAIFAALYHSVRAFQTDDAYITLRHAARFAAGDGPVWNAGGAACEGFSNPLLLIIEAGVLAVGGDGMQAARVVSWLSAASLLVLMRRLGTPIFGAEAAAGAAFLFAAWSPLAFWSHSGLETASVALVVTVAGLLLARSDGGNPLAAGLTLAVLPWLRPEGPIPALLLAAASEGPRFLSLGQRARALQRLLRIAGPVIVSAAVLEGLRYAVYGHFAPNSAVLKMGVGESGRVALAFLSQLWPAGALIAAGLVTLPGRSWLVLVPAIVWLGGAVEAWDNVNEFGRFLLPTVPAWLLVATTGIVSLSRAAGGGWALSGGITATLGAVVLTWPNVSVAETTEFANTYKDCKTRVRRQAAEWIRANSAPDAVYGLVDVGLVSWIADGQALDTLGLNDPRIQHTGAQEWADRAALVMSDRPDYLMIVSDSATTLDIRYQIDQAIVAHPDFAAHYRVAEVVAADDCPYHLYIYEREAAAP